MPSSPLITDSITQAAHWLNAGHLLAYPTESVWGLGCDPFDERAVQQLLTIKQRPIEKGMIVVTDRVERIAPLLATLDHNQLQTVLASWQPYSDTLIHQAHTWLLPINNQLEVSIPDWITGAHNSVAVRVIAHPLIQQLCAQLVSAANPYGFLVSTSCNPSGEPPALTFSEAKAYFLDDSKHFQAKKEVNNANTINENKNNQLIKQVGYLRGDTLSYQLPSQIGDALTGQVIR